MHRDIQGQEFDDLIAQMTIGERLQVLAFILWLHLRSIFTAPLFAPGTNPTRIVTLHTLSLTAVLVAWPPADAASIVLVWAMAIATTLALNDLIPR